jgi:S-DNA-T family DNA segregation ATPase FtsK/SpoIIIE
MSDEDEDLIEQCIEIIRVERVARIALFQRRLRLGYSRARAIMDELESRGIVGPMTGLESGVQEREVLLPDTRPSQP